MGGVCFLEAVSRNPLSFWVTEEQPMAYHATGVHEDTLSVAAGHSPEAIRFQSDLITHSDVAKDIWLCLRQREPGLIHEPSQYRMRHVFFSHWKLFGAMRF